MQEGMWSNNGIVCPYSAFFMHPCMYPFDFIKTKNFNHLIDFWT